jgi:hypothetical protein
VVDTTPPVVARPKPLAAFAQRAIAAGRRSIVPLWTALASS